MLKQVFIVFLCLISFKGVGIEIKLFADSEDLYFVLANKSDSPFDAAKVLLLGDCEYFANICLRIVDEQKKEVRILARPMRFDHEFKKRMIIEQNQLYGFRKSKNEVIRRFGLKNGCYQVSLIYQDKKHDLIAESEPTLLAVSKGKAVGECDTSFGSKLKP